MSEQKEELTALVLAKLNIGSEELFLPKYRKSRLSDITWKDFIIASFTLSLEDLYSYCGYKSRHTFAICLKDRYPEIVEKKGRETWKTWFLSLIDYKYCSSCNNIKRLVEFNKDSSRKSGLDSNCNACTKKYHKEHLPSFASYAAKYKAALIGATPNWANLIDIKQIYETCQEGYHVDHIVPLQNDLVCGLHCEFNLQHLTAEENLAKSNKFVVL